MFLKLLSVFIALKNITTESKTRALKETPVIRADYMLFHLMDALRRCMTNTQALNSIELDGLPLSNECLEELIKVILSSKL